MKRFQEISKYFCISNIKNILLDITDGNFLSWKFIRKQIVIIIIFFIVTLVYIGNRYTCDKMRRQQRELTKEIEDLRFEYLCISANLTEMRRGSVIEDSVKTHIPELGISKTASFIITED